MGMQRWTHIFFLLVSQSTAVRLLQVVGVNEAWVPHFRRLGPVTRPAALQVVRPGAQPKLQSSAARPLAVCAAGPRSRHEKMVMETTVSGPALADSWQLDFYSRPVMGVDNKKLWELLVTDETGTMRHVEPVPSNCINSRELRTRVQRLIESMPEKPREIRFFRAEMKNMISIALQDLDVELRPSRVAYALQDWIDEREKDVYPKMQGYRRPRPAPSPGLKMPVRLPDQLRGEQYAVATLPLAEFLPGGALSNSDSDASVGFGNLCPLPADVATAVPPDTMVPGLIVFSQRANAIAAWFGGLDVAFVSASIGARELLIEVGLDKQYLFARLRSPQQLLEAERLEDAKKETRGLHFLSIQSSAEDEPSGFWLLRDLDARRS